MLPMALLLGGIGAAMAEEVTVQVQTLVVRSGKGSMYPPVGQAKKDQKLAVTERQGDWLKVKIDGKDGFVKETALRPAGATGLSAAMEGAANLTGGTSDVGASAAARGLTDDAEGYASAKGMSTAGVEQMIKNRDRVAGQRWIEFTKEGRVGPSKP